MTEKKILLLGATGRTGRFVADLLEKRGIAFNCLVRDKSKVKDHDLVTIFEGDVQQVEDLQKAMVGCSSIINVLNISRVNDFPWSQLRTPRNLLSNTTRSVIELTKNNPLNHYVMCSAWGVGNTKRDLPFWFKLLIDYSNIGIAYQDHERQEALLQEITVPFTVVRPVGLLNGKKIEPVSINSDHPKLTINRITLANFMIDCIQNQHYLNQKITLSAN